MAGRDPRVPPTKPREETETVLTVATFLDQYFTNYVEAEGLKSTDTIGGHIKALKASLGELPVTALEKVRIPLQVDVGGDAVVPLPDTIDYPSPSTFLVRAYVFTGRCQTPRRPKR